MSSTNTRAHTEGSTTILIDGAHSSEVKSVGGVSILTLVGRNVNATISIAVSSDNRGSSNRENLAPHGNKQVSKYSVGDVTVTILSDPKSSVMYSILQTPSQDSQARKQHDSGGQPARTQTQSKGKGKGKTVKNGDRIPHAHDAEAEATRRPRQKGKSSERRGASRGKSTDRGGSKRGKSRDRLQTHTAAPHSYQAARAEAAPQASSVTGSGPAEEAAQVSDPTGLVWDEPTNSDCTGQGWDDATSGSGVVEKAAGSEPVEAGRHDNDIGDTQSEISVSSSTGPTTDRGAAKKKKSDLPPVNKTDNMRLRYDSSGRLCIYTAFESRLTALGGSDEISALKWPVVAYIENEQMKLCCGGAKTTKKTVHEVKHGGEHNGTHPVSAFDQSQQQEQLETHLQKFHVVLPEDLNISELSGEIAVLLMAVYDAA